MKILLFGVSNVGKTTCAKLLAEKIGYTFYDLDEEVKKALHTTLEDFINNIENIDEIQIINTSSYFNENKEDINLILDYIYILIFNKTKDFSNKIKYIFAMEKVQKAKEKLSKSNNFDMTIDNMLIEIWREINEKNYRS